MHRRANGNLKYFEYQLSKQRREEEDYEEESRQRTGQTDDYLPERKKYEQLCRGKGLRMVKTHIHTHTHPAV